MRFWLIIKFKLQSWKIVNSKPAAIPELVISQLCSNLGTPLKKKYVYVYERYLYAKNNGMFYTDKTICIKVQKFRKYSISIGYKKMIGKKTQIKFNLKTSPYVNRDERRQLLSIGK